MEKKQRGGDKLGQGVGALKKRRGGGGRAGTLLRTKADL